jgi:hypothetical protein
MLPAFTVSSIIEMCLAGKENFELTFRCIALQRKGPRIGNDFIFLDKQMAISLYSNTFGADTGENQ